MIYVSDAAEMNLLDADEKLNLFEFIKTPRYRVGDTSLTYRQAHLLSKDGVLDAQEDEGKWRKFSFNELVYVLIVQELKQMGFSNKQFVSLHEVFFKEKSTPADKKGIFKPTGYAPMAIGYALIGVPLILKYTHDGHADFYDPSHFAVLGCAGKSFVYINLNEIINDFSEKIGKDIKLKTDTLFATFVHSLLERDNVSDKERRLLEILRDEACEGIKVQKKADGTLVVHAKKSAGTSGIDPIEFLRGVGNHDFQNIEIHRRNGEVVHLSMEDVEKL